MLCVRASKLEGRLNKLAQITGKTKSHIVRTALEIFLDEHSNLLNSSLPANLDIEERFLQENRS